MRILSQNSVSRHRGLPRKKNVKPMDKWSDGNDFFIGVSPDPKNGNTIWSKDQKIGTYFCDSFAATTSANGIVLPENGKRLETAICLRL